MLKFILFVPLILTFIGSSVTGHSHPYLLSLQGIESEIGWQHICTGVLLTPNKVLTSGNCGAFRYPYIDLFPVRVVAGMSDPWAMGSEIQAIDLHKGDWEYHPNYTVIHEDPDFLISDYDFVVINLESNFTLTDVVQTIKLIQDTIVEVDLNCTYLTWGIPTSPSVGRDVREVGLTLTDHDWCVQEATEFNVTQHMICAWQEAEHRLHFGQRGDPLLCTGDSGPYLAGINSWNVKYFYEPEAKFKQGLFANISDGYSWIVDNL